MISQLIEKEINGIGREKGRKRGADLDDDVLLNELRGEIVESHGHVGHRSHSQLDPPVHLLA